MFKQSRLAALLILAAAFTYFQPATAHAQKPALVRNQDEPGRNPYQYSVSFVQSPSTCDQFSCAVSFPLVPGGYRLVITHASASFSVVNAATTDANVTLCANGDIFDNTLQLPAPVGVGGKIRSVSSPVTYFVEPGSTPFIVVAASGIATSNVSASVAIVGYLVAIP